MAKLHYVPKFYLQGFTDPETPSGHEPYLWVYERGKTAGWTRRAPKNVAAETDFYVIKGRTGERGVEVEQALQLIEDSAARILRRKVLKNRLLKRDERVGLAAFVVTMLNRVPAEVENIRHFIGEAIHKTAFLGLEALKRNPRRLESFRGWYKQKTGEDLELESIEDLDPSGYHVEVDRGYAAATALAPLRELVPLVASMGWTFWISGTDDPFVASDFPVGILNRSKPVGPVGLAFKHVEVTIALSRSVALAAGWSRPDTIRSLPATKEVVEEVNIRSVMRSDTLFSPKPHFPGEQVLFGSDGWISAQTEPNVATYREEDGYLVGFSLPRPWYPKRRLLALTTQ